MRTRFSGRSASRGRSVWIESNDAELASSRINASRRRSELLSNCFNELNFDH